MPPHKTRIFHRSPQIFHPLPNAEMVPTGNYPDLPVSGSSTKFKSYNGGEIIVGAVFWFIISIFLVYLSWFIVKKIWSKYFH